MIKSLLPVCSYVLIIPVRWKPILVSIILSSLLLFGFNFTDFRGFVFHFARITIILSTGFHLKIGMSTFLNYGAYKIHYTITDG